MQHSNAPVVMAEISNQIRSPFFKLSVDWKENARENVPS